MANRQTRAKARVYIRDSTPMEPLSSCNDIFKSPATH